MTRGHTAVLIAVLLLASACGGKHVTTIAANTADYGTTLAKGIKATAQAVADAEAQKMIERNDAVKVMNTLLAITNKSDEAATMLRLLVNAQGTPEAAGLAGQVQTALDFINTELFTVLVPIKDEGLKQRIGALAAEVSRTVALINREVLGRIQ